MPNFGVALRESPVCHRLLTESGMQSLSSGSGQAGLWRCSCVLPVCFCLVLLFLAAYFLRLRRESMRSTSGRLASFRLRWPRLCLPINIHFGHILSR